MSRSSLTVSLVICFTLLSAGLLSLGADNTATGDFAPSEDWPMFRLDLHHTGFKDGEAPETNELGWMFDTGTNSRWVVSSPMIVDGYVYVGSDNGKLYKLDVRNGAEVWNYTAGSGTLAQFWSSPCVDLMSGMVFCHANGVHAVDMVTGERIWHFETMNREFSSPVVYEDMVFVGSYDNHLYCLPKYDPNEDGTIDDNEVIWYYETGEYKSGARVEGTGGAVSTTVAIADGVVYGAEQTYYNSGTTYSDYYVFALPLEDPNGNGVIDHNEILWKYQIGEKVPEIDLDIPGEGGEAFSSPTLNPELGQLYIGSRAAEETDLQYFYCLSLDPSGDGMDNDLDGIFDNEGEMIWRLDTDNEIFSSPSIHDGVVYFGTGQYSFSASPGSVYAVPEEDPNGDGEITQGEIIWRNQGSDGFLSSPLIADGKVYIGSNDAHLYCFDEESGDEVWKYQASGGSRNNIGSSPSLYKEQIVVGSCNGMVYSFFEAGNNKLPKVSITSPRQGETLDGIFDVRGKASDDGEVAKVEISVNEGNSWSRVNLQSNGKWNYSLDTSKLANGTRIILARAYDGMLYSENDSVDVNIREGNLTLVEEEDEGFEIAGMSGALVIGGGFLLLVVFGLGYMLMKGDEEEDFDDDEDEPGGEEEEEEDGALDAEMVKDGDTG